jgi:hypothetical protein
MRSDSGAEHDIHEWRSDCSICGRTVEITTSCKARRDGSSTGLLVSVVGYGGRRSTSWASTSRQLEALLNVHKKRESGQPDEI